MGGFGDDSFPSTDDPLWSSSPSSSYSDSGCQLSPHDGFLSSTLTSFLGSVITGISSGFLVAFITAWICWFSALRIIVTGSYFTWQAANGRDLETSPWAMKIFNSRKRAAQAASSLLPMGSGANGPMAQVPMNNLSPEHEALAVDGRSPHAELPPPYEPASGLLDGERQDVTAKTPLTFRGRELRQAPRADPPSTLGWMGWIYGTLYFPVVQILFLASNWGKDSEWSGNIKLVRAIGVGVTALPLTFDTKARYAAMLQSKEDKWYGGRWSNRLFTWAHALATLVLGITEAILLALAYKQMGAKVFFVPLYIVLSTVWMLASFVFIPPVDGGMAPNTVWLFLGGLAMGIFGGAFTSAAAFANMSQAPSSPGMSLGSYLQCEGASALDKFVAIFP